MVRRPALYRLGMAAVYLLASLFVFTMWATDVREFVGLNGYYRALFADMIEGTAHKPFVYRVLIPSLVRGGRMLLPEAIIRFLQEGIYEAVPLAGRAMTYLGWEQHYLPEYLLALSLAYVALLGYMVALRQLGKSLFAAEAWLLDLLPVISLLVLPVFFKRGTHLIYDFSTLFLFTLGAYYLLQEQWAPFYALYVIGNLNKETTVLLSLIFLIRFWRRMDAPTLLVHLVVQGVIFLGIKVPLMLIYHDNPGGLFETHLVENVRLYLRPYWYTAVWDVLSVFLLIGHRFREKPLFLKQGLCIALPMAALVFALGGYGEIRDMYEAFPFAFLLGAQTVAWLMGWHMEAIDEPAGSSPSLPLLESKDRP
ncbi:MAG: hypothetical protein FJZ90_01655, partial [Chloroflexi bacterium]|nr:hypothetical protein [Chloroflexota bacterium]